ncbi:VWA domain-containing protein [Methylophilus sp. 5]|uniref:vWA domain-containing protein n=1 Tax=Methylophilus sp. 5 TaxID=1112274 RepID=UPI00048D4009|nr:vWA domain-containing protein [Methylophilus sp. 5]
MWSAWGQSLSSATGLGTYWGISQGWPLLLLPLALLPWVLRGQQYLLHPALQGLPQDPLSVWLERTWKIALSLLIVALSVALAKPFLYAQMVEKVGRGAHVMIVLDRSASMNEPFVSKGDAQTRQPKMQVAREVLKSLVTQGRDDLMGMVTFSTSPILAAPLGNDRVYVQAALDATEAGGMGFTAVARGVGMALDYFADQPVTGARAIVLVSDGGAHLDGKTQDMLRAMFMRQKAALYWIYLRSANGVSLKQNLADGENIDAYPEVALHEYFQTLNVPYRMYEAENPQAVKAAVRDIAKLKNKPTRYLEPVSRQDLSQYAYWLAWLAAFMLAGMVQLELKQWQA